LNGDVLNENIHGKQNFLPMSFLVFFLSDHKNLKKSIHPTTNRTITTRDEKCTAISCYQTVKDIKFLRSHPS
jgi:hypothetical protein